MPDELVIDPLEALRHDISRLQNDVTVLSQALSQFMAVATPVIDEHQKVPQPPVYIPPYRPDTNPQ